MFCFFFSNIFNIENFVPTLPLSTTSSTDDHPHEPCCCQISTLCLYSFGHSGQYFLIILYVCTINIMMYAIRKGFRYYTSIIIRTLPQLIQIDP